MLATPPCIVHGSGAVLHYCCMHIGMRMCLLLRGLGAAYRVCSSSSPPGSGELLCRLQLLGNPPHGRTPAAYHGTTVKMGPQPPPVVFSQSGEREPASHNRLRKSRCSWRRPDGDPGSLRCRPRLCQGRSATPGKVPRVLTCIHNS